MAIVEGLFIRKDENYSKSSSLRDFAIETLDSEKKRNKILILVKEKNLFELEEQGWCNLREVLSIIEEL